MKCQVCVYNRKQNVVCQNCNYNCCSYCYQRYLLSVSEPICMNCKVVHSTDFIYNNTSHTFYKKYMLHSNTILFEHEKQLLQSTQRLATTEIKKRQILKDIHTEIDMLAKESRKLIQRLNQHNLPINDVLIITSMRSKIQQQIHELHEASYDIRHMPFVIPEIDKEPKTNAIKCIDDNCRGYMIQNICGLCSKKRCESCHKENHHGHECKEEDIASVKLIHTDSKPCPNCHTMITKLTGCDQMWCVICKTAFGWKSGQILNASLIHNPHQEEYKLSNIRLPSRQSFFDCVAKIDTMESYVIMNIYDEAIRIKLNLYDISHHTSDEDIQHHNTFMRIRFLLKDFSETKWFRFFCWHNKYITDLTECIQIRTNFIDKVMGWLMNLYTTQILSYTDLREYSNKYNQDIHKFIMKQPVANIKTNTIDMTNFTDLICIESI